MTDAEKILWENALNLLEHRSLSCAQIRKKLASNLKGVTEDDIENTINHLKKLGLINDKKYAEDRSRFLLERKFMAPKMIAIELKSDGIDELVIEEVLDNIAMPEKRDQIILKFLDKKYPNRDKNIKEKRRAINALLRRGYEYQDCLNALGEDCR